MPIGKKKGNTTDQSKWVRTGGAIGDNSMEELHDFNSKFAGVDNPVGSKVINVGDQEDPNSGLHLLDSPLEGSEDGE